MSQNKTPQRAPLPSDVERQVNEAQQLVREAGRALKRLEEKTRVVLINRDEVAIEPVVRERDDAAR